MKMTAIDTLIACQSTHRARMCLIDKRINDLTMCELRAVLVSPFSMVQYYSEIVRTLGELQPDAENIDPTVIDVLAKLHSSVAMVELSALARSVGVGGMH